MAYPPIEPYETGLLDVGDGKRVWWTAAGNPGGTPALIVHGGPGSGSSSANPYGGRPERDLLALVRICAHYASHRLLVPDNAIFDRIDRLAGIPGVLLHGRVDLSGPALNPWELSEAWPDSRLTLFSGAGHKGDAAMGEALVAALDDFASRTNP